MGNALESARRKILRAMEQRRAFDDCITRYRKDKSVEVVPDSDGTPTFHVLKHPPLDIAVLAGEVLYQCRSALDHIFFELVERTYGGNLPAALAKASQFPLCSTTPTGYSAPVPKDKLLAKERLCDWVPDESYTFIERLQPYYRSNPGHDLLRLLAVLSNIDKHRHLTPTIIRAQVREIAVSPTGNSVVLGVPLKDGAKVLPLYHLPDVLQGEVKVKRDIHFNIAFDEPEFGPPQCAPLSKIVYDLPTHILWITSRFQKFLG